MKLDAGTLERLVYLRSLLRQAQQRSFDRTHAGRHEAAILDGVCEHAMLLALGRLGESPTKNFHGHYGKLKEQLVADWTPDGWSGVDRLHGTRTEAQHRGTVPDSAELSRWSADVERFVNSVIAATFEVDLQTISTAGAVETEEVREQLELAETSLSAGRFRESWTDPWLRPTRSGPLWDLCREECYLPPGRNLADRQCRRQWGPARWVATASA